MNENRKRFLDMDAGQMREYLADRIADWLACQYVSPSEASAIRRQVSILAKILNRPTSEVYEELLDDANTLVEQELSEEE